MVERPPEFNRKYVDAIAAMADRGDDLPSLIGAVSDNLRNKDRIFGISTLTASGAIGVIMDRFPEEVNLIRGMIGVGELGLEAALDFYDRFQDIEVSAYAEEWIKGQLSDELERKGQSKQLIPDGKVRTSQLILKMKVGFNLMMVSFALTVDFITNSKEVNLALDVIEDYFSHYEGGSEKEGWFEDWDGSVEKYRASLRAIIRDTLNEVPNVRELASDKYVS